MAWFRLDDQGAFHEKVIEAGNEAYGAWCRAGQWSSGRGTEGRITRAMALTIAPLKIWLKLIAAKGRSEMGLVEAAGDDFQMHDFLDWNPTVQEVDERRATRAEAGRQGGLRKAENARRRQQPSSNGASKPSSNELADAKQNSAPTPIPTPIPIPIPIPIPVPIPEEIKISPRAPDLPPGGSPSPAGSQGQPAQPQQPYRPGFVSGSTTMPQPPPADIAIDDDIVGYCFGAGTPVPTRDHVLKFLANARSKGYEFPNWIERFKLWMLDEKKRALRERDRPGLAAGGGFAPEAVPAIHREIDPESINWSEERTRRGRPAEAPYVPGRRAPVLTPRRPLAAPGPPAGAPSEVLPTSTPSMPSGAGEPS